MERFLIFVVWDYLRAVILKLSEAHIFLKSRKLNTWQLKFIAKDEEKIFNVASTKCIWNCI